MPLPVIPTIRPDRARVLAVRWLEPNRLFRCRAVYRADRYRVLDLGDVKLKYFDCPVKHAEMKDTPATDTFFVYRGQVFEAAQVREGLCGYCSFALACLFDEEHTGADRPFWTPIP